MFSKKTLKTIIAAMLAVVCVLSLFACGGTKNEIIAENNGQFAIQWENKRYYFKQGCSTDWMFTEVDAAEKYKISTDTGLVCVLAPIDGAALTEAEVESTKSAINYPITNGKTAVDGVEYCIYHIYGKNKGIAMQDSAENIVTRIMDDNDNLGFNNLNNRGEARTAYTKTGEATLFTAKYSKVQFNKVDYTFTEDGEDMKGSFFFVASQDLEYFVVTYEAKASLYDQYYDSFVELIGDFRKVGKETSKD